MSQKIRIKLKSYDHKLVDKSAEKIVKAVKSTPLTALPSLTRRLVSSSSCQTTSVSSTSTALPLRLLMP